MDEIKATLKTNGYSQVEIEKFLSHFQYAKDNNMPYPFLYAMTKITL